MELYQLYTFIAVAREKHLTRAAEKLCITQPAVSSQIKQLEDEFGLMLFTRSSKGMELTGAGQKIMDDALKVIKSCEELKNRAANLSGKVMGQLKLGINTTFSLLKIDALTRTLSEKYPELTIHLINKSSPEIINETAAKRLDIGFVFGDCPDIIKSITLADLDVVIMGPKKVEKQASTMELSELSAFRWVKPPDWCPFKKATDRIFKEKGLRITNYIVSESDELMKELATEQESFTLVLRANAVKVLEEGKMFIWPHYTFKVPLKVVFNENNLENGTFKIVLSTLLEQWEKSL